jgi:hypothetical protein
MRADTQTMKTMNAFVLLLKIEYGGPETILERELPSESSFGVVEGNVISLDSAVRIGTTAETPVSMLVVGTVEKLFQFFYEIDFCFQAILLLISRIRSEENEAKLAFAESKIGRKKNMMFETAYSIV